SVRISTNALRSSARAMALRISGSLNGGESRLTIRLVLTLVGAVSQIALAAWFFTSFAIGMLQSYGKDISPLPARKARTAVERLAMMVYSIPSSSGRPAFQYWGFFTTLMYSLALNSTNLKGPVPIGLMRMFLVETWQGYTGVYPEAKRARSDGCGRFST